MTKLFRSLILLAVVPCLSLAAIGFTIGGGLNSSFTSNEYEGDFELPNRLGFNVGVGLESELAPGFFLMPEVNIETRGEKVKDDAGSSEATIKMLYLQVPVFAMYKIPAGQAAISFFGGPVLGILLSAELEVEMGGDSETGDIKDSFKYTDFGIELGTGVEFPAGQGTFFIRPSYYIGMKDVTLNSQSDTKLRNIKLKVGFKFPM